MQTIAPPEPLGQTLPTLLEEFLAESREAVVLEDGVAVFDLRTARYSISADRGKCLLHFWSPERNAVRRVLSVEEKPDTLRMQVQRFGQAKASKLEICRNRDRRAPSARKAARADYQRRLQIAVEREFPGWKLDRLTSSMDLERSLGPVHARGLLRRGASGFAVIGTGSGESQASVDDSVASAAPWLDICRREFAMRGYVEGVKIVCPPRTSAMAAARMAALDPQLAKWQLYELDERDGTLAEVDCADRGNVATHLVRCPDEHAARERFAGSIARVRAALHPPNAAAGETPAPHAALEVAVISASEIGFRVFGLEFARARLAPEEHGFRLAEEICFGVGAAETVLSDDTAAQFASLARRVAEVRRPGGDRNHPLYRMQPERWLESLVARKLEAIEAEFDPSCAYVQVPAFSASDRAVIDVLTVTRRGRLAVIELKAEEDLQLPMQGLDYWSRVRWHHERGEFQRFGYFPGRELSPEPPLLYLVAPALRVHPTTDALLRCIAPEIEVCVAGIDERWREGVRVVFRKHRNARPAAAGM